MKSRVHRAPAHPKHKQAIEVEAPASMRNPSENRQSVGMGSPLDSGAILSSTTKRCSTAECNAQKSSPVIRKRNRKSLSCTCPRPELMLKRAQVPSACTRGGVTQAAAAARGTTTATTATAKRATRRAATARSGRCTPPDRRTKRPSAKARLATKTAWWGDTAGRGRSGSRVKRQQGKGSPKPSLGGGERAPSRRYRRAGSGRTWHSGSRQGGEWGGAAWVHRRGGRRAL